MAGAPWLGAAGCLRRSLCGNQIHSAERYPAEQMLCQIAAEGSAVIQIKAEVLVHVKGVDPGKSRSCRSRLSSISFCEGAAAKITFAVSFRSRTARMALAAASAAAYPIELRESYTDEKSVSV